MYLVGRILEKRGSARLNASFDDDSNEDYKIQTVMNLAVRV